MTPQWILRKGTKRSGFRYVTTGGKPAPESARTRAAALVIPPAWTDVHIAASPTAAVQAWGFDAKGRKQYRYHDKAAERGQLRKFYRVRQMARDLPAIRAAVAKDFRARGLTKRRVAAAVVRLIGESFFRVGSDRYAEENKTFGVATLRKKHVAVHDDRVVFDYIGKESIRQHQVVFAPDLVAFIRELLATPGPRLFRYQSKGDDGRLHWHDLSSRDVNEYMHDVLGVPYSAKDFRTWGGTLRLATILADIGPGKTARESQKNLVVALRLVASELGNTPTVCRKAYVHPLVIARYLDEGTTIAPFLTRAAVTRANARAASGGRGHEGHPPEERALIGFLDKYFPERRTKQRDRRKRDREAAGERRTARAVADAA
ncbi:MAG TPA: hypothetical protein VGD56_10755 [Gemmatirosa sp.]